MTQVKVKSNHPNNYLSKSKKALGEKTTQAPSNCLVTSDLFDNTNRQTKIQNNHI